MTQPYPLRQVGPKSAEAVLPSLGARFFPFRFRSLTTENLEGRSG